MILLVALFACEKREWNNPFDPDVKSSSWDLNAQVIIDGEVKLTWADNLQGEDGYRIDRKLDAGEWTTGFATLSENTTAFTDTTAFSELAELYTYRLYGAAGGETTEGVETSLDVDNNFSGIKAPTYLTATSGELSITLNWKDNSLVEDGYKIDRREESGSWVVGYAEVGVNVETFTDNSVETGKTYTYRVYAFNGTEVSEKVEVARMVVEFPFSSFTTSGNASWFETTSEPYYGTSSFRSGSIGHNQTTSIEISVSNKSSVSFYWKVSSEFRYDFLSFYIDGLMQNRISGSVYWQIKQYDLSSGSHTLRWTYSKDGSYSSGTDAGWIDKVVIQ